MMCSSPLTFFLFLYPDSILLDGLQPAGQKYVRGLVLSRTQKIHLDILLFPLRNITGLKKSAKFGLNFGLQSPLARYGFETKQRN